MHVEFEPGLTHVEAPSARSPIVHRLACARLCETRGPAYWIDARNAASTHALYDCAPSERPLERLRVARAFTAYQHHSLVRTVARRAGGETTLLVAPNVADLYGDDDLLAGEGEDLLAATLATLRELGRALECPALVTTTGDAPAAVAEYADAAVECVRTREGIRLEGDGANTAGYWHGDWWQTTIPYWVDVCGAVERDPAVAAHDAGLVAVDAPAGTDPDGREVLA